MISSLYLFIPMGPASKYSLRDIAYPQGDSAYPLHDTSYPCAGKGSRRIQQNYYVLRGRTSHHRPTNEDNPCRKDF